MEGRGATAPTPGEAGRKGTDCHSPLGRKGILPWTAAGES